VAVWLRFITRWSWATKLLYIGSG